jgi:hypothetical protein
MATICMTGISTVTAVCLTGAAVYEIGLRRRCNVNDRCKGCSKHGRYMDQLFARLSDELQGA